MATVIEPDVIQFSFQDGPQKLFGKSKADILIYGGEAGGGKSFALVGQMIRHIHNPKFRGGIFRRTTTQITGEGGIWDEARELYPRFGGRMREGSSLDCIFPSGARVGFHHLQHEKTVYDHQSKQYCLLAFDEATHFTRKQLLYMFSRNRSTCGIAPYIRMSCNPDPASFVAELVAWHIDDDGYAIPERDGVIRYLIIDDEEIHFFGTKAEAMQSFPEWKASEIYSFTFIHATLDDNPVLLAKDPGYRARLRSLPKIERDRLMGGNWKSREGAIIATSDLGRYIVAGENYQTNFANQFVNLPISKCRRFATIDTAGTSKEKAREKMGDPASYSVCAVWDYWRDKDLLFLVDVWRDRVEWLDLKARIPEVLRKWNVRQVNIENAHFGQPLSKELGGFQIQLVGPMIPGMDDTSRGAKLERAIASGLLARIEDGRLLIPKEGGRWVRTYLDELAAWTGLPKETADQIDVSSYASHETKN